MTGGGKVRIRDLERPNDIARVIDGILQTSGSGGGGGGTQDVNIIEILGAAVSDANPLPVRIVPMKEILSASTQGRPIILAAALSNIHVVPVNQTHAVTIFVSNRGTGDGTVSIDWGSGVADLDVFVPTNETVIAVAGVPLVGASTIRAQFAGTGASVKLTGYFEDTT